MLYLAILIAHVQERKQGGKIVPKIDQLSTLFSAILSQMDIQPELWKNESKPGFCNYGCEFKIKL